MLRLITLLLLSVCLFSAADDARTYIKAGMLVEVIGAKTLRDQVIIVEGDKIVRVGPAADVPIPVNASLIDLSAKTVLPGFIDLHDHLTGDHRFHGYSGLGISVPRETLYGVLNARKTLNAGFTSVRNVGASGYSDVALRDAINDGEIDGPRLRTAPTASRRRSLPGWNQSSTRA